MRNVLLIAWREFAESTRTKGFWIGIFLFPLVWVIAGTIPVLIQKKATPVRHFVIADPAGRAEPLIRAALEREQADRTDRALTEFARRPGSAALFGAHRGAGGELDLAAWKRERGDAFTNVPGFTPPRPRFIAVPLPPDLAGTRDPAQFETALRPYLRGSQALPGLPARTPLFAAVIVPSEYDGTTNHAPVRFWTVNQADTDLRDRVESALSTAARRAESARLGVDPAVLTRLEGVRAPLVVLNPAKAAGEERVGTADAIRQWAPSAFVYLLWVAIFAVNQMLLNSVIEEKSNRLIEVLLSSVTPGEFMGGKLVGIAAVGLVTLASWLLSFLLVGFLVARPGAAAPGAANLPADVASILRTTWLVPGFLVYFLLGYQLYATLFLTIGSTCNTLKDAQSYMGPMMLVLMIPLFLLPFIPRDPNGTLATVMSWIPPFTPFVMMNRITGNPPWRDVIGTTLLLAAFNAFLLWACARIFRRAILLTGQPPRLLELLRWIRG